MERITTTTGQSARALPTLLAALIFYFIFQLSLNQQRLRKKSWKLKAVSKNNHAKALNDCRPVTLTSLVMESLDKLPINKLLNDTAHLLDLSQFTCMDLLMAVSCCPSPLFCAPMTDGVDLRIVLFKTLLTTQYC